MSDDDDDTGGAMQTPVMTMAQGNPFGKADRWLNRTSVGAVRRLGQPVWEPTSPAGFEESFAAWVSSAQLTGRIAWAQRVASEFGGRTDPDAFARAVLRDAARDDTIRIVSQAPSKPAGLALALASPEFNRR